MRRSNNRAGRGSRGIKAGRGPNANKDRKKEYLFKPHGQGKDRQAISYGKIVEKITTKIQATYDHGHEIAWSIKHGKRYDFDQLKPKLEGEKPSTADTVMFKIEVESWLNRKNLFDANWKKAYSFIYQDYCTAGMKTAVQELPEFASEIEDDPLKLLSAVQKLMHTPMRAIYPYMGLSEAIARLINMRQHEEEDIISYVDRFKQERQIVRSLLGKEFLEEFTKNTKEYEQLSADDDGIIKRAKMVSNSFECFTTAIFLRGAQGRRFGSLLDNYRSQYAGGRDHYPKDLLSAVDALRTHKPDNKKEKQKKDNKKQKDEGETATSFAQRGTEKRCYACGSKEHLLNECPVKDNIARNKWFDRSNREFNHHQNEAENNDDDVSVVSDMDVSTRSNTSAATAAWSGAQLHKELCLSTKEERSNDEDEVILDSGSTVSLFKS